MIPTIIPKQNFELVADKIASILHSEFINQVDEFYNTSCEGVTFFSDRTVPLDKTESAAIVISTYKGEYDQLQAVGIQDGTIQYLIRIMCNSPTIGTDRGDKLSGLKLRQLVGIVRYILMHPIYVNLGLPGGIIGHTELSNFQIDIKDIDIDASSTAVAHMIFKVEMREDAIIDEGNIIQGNSTTVKIELTDQGYKYQF